MQTEGNLLMKVLPRVWMVLDEIHHRYIRKITNENPSGQIEEKSILWDGEVRLINLAKATNTKIKIIDPKIAISHRKFLEQGNPDLFKFLERQIGDNLSKDINSINKLLELSEDPIIVDEIGKIKQKHKFEIAQMVFDQYRIKINPYALFDAHIMQVDEKNRQ
ncbi:glycogen/starch/alpha-glucan phosphorylase, partial [Vibrio parahaemolyticus]|nr:glycogen/starch/alpha-glucan phosphorylase [Vibrio parahaemolyticus]